MLLMLLMLLCMPRVSGMGSRSRHPSCCCIVRTVVEFLQVVRCERLCLGGWWWCLVRHQLHSSGTGDWNAERGTSEGRDGSGCQILVLLRGHLVDLVDKLHERRVFVGSGRIGRSACILCPIRLGTVQVSGIRIGPRERDEVRRGGSSSRGGRGSAGGHQFTVATLLLLFAKAERGSVRAERQRERGE